MTDRAAEQYARRSLNVPPGVMLGWKPYRVLVTKDGISYRAFHRARDLRKVPELRKVKLCLSRTGSGVRYAAVEP